MFCPDQLVQWDNFQALKSLIHINTFCIETGECHVPVYHTVHDLEDGLIFWAQLFKANDVVS